MKAWVIMFSILLPYIYITTKVPITLSLYLIIISLIGFVGLKLACLFLYDDYELGSRIAEGKTMVMMFGMMCVSVYCINLTSA